MPEGVEVKLSAETIKPLIQNHVLIFAKTTANSRYGTKDPEGLSAFTKAMEAEELYHQGGMQVLDIKTRGKFMYWKFSNDWYMFCTFGMTGQWAPQRGKHPCFVFTHTYNQTTSSSSEMVFNDPRHFGTIKFTNNKQDLTDKLNELGWDPLQDKLDDNLPFLQMKLSATSKPIGQVMMEQNIFAGVGNYIRAEALYLAQISPWRLANQLTKDQVKLLCQSCIDVMEESYKHQGATIQTYKTAYGEEGRYSSCFKVYGKKTDPLGNKIIKEDTPDGRTIHWCPTVQK